MERVDATDRVSYLLFQLERGDSGTLHFQGMVIMSKRQKLNFMKNHISSTAHWEVMKGNVKSNIKYVTKLPRVDGPWEVGSFEEEKRGKRNDLCDFRDAVKAGKTFRELVETHPVQLANYPRFAERIRQHCDIETPQMREPHQVILHYGEPGTGKTHTVREGKNKSELYVLPDEMKWFDGYSGQPEVLVDDFAGAASHIRLSKLLQYIDKYPIQVPIKCGWTNWNPSKIYITTNIHPRDWYKWEGREVHYRALKRRFTKVILFESNLRQEELVVQDFFQNPDSYRPMEEVGNPSLMNSDMSGSGRWN